MDAPDHRDLGTSRAAGPFARARRGLRPADAAARQAAAERHDRLAKPRGALGRLEALGIQLAGIAGQCPPPLPQPAAVAVFAGDHGVTARGVTPWPSDVTGLMVATFCAGGAAINVLAEAVGASVTVVDVGVAADLPPAPRLLARKVRRGTADLTAGPAMTADEATAALDVGAEVAALLVEEGAGALVTGEMGIGNTTPAAAVIAALTGRPAAEVTGRGTGIDDAMHAQKVAVVDAALSLHDSAVREGPLAVLAALGGLEIAALAGFIVGGVAARVPVLVDGVIADAALLVAASLEPIVVEGCIAGHRSVEPGAAAVLDHLGLEPVLDLGLRLGEGTGACLAVPIVSAAAAVLRDMATLDEVGVSPS